MSAALGKTGFQGRTKPRPCRWKPWTPCGEESPWRTMIVQHHQGSTVCSNVPSWPWECPGGKLTARGLTGRARRSISRHPIPMSPGP